MILNDGGGGITERSKRFVFSHRKMLKGKITKIKLIPEQRFNRGIWNVEDYTSFNMIVSTKENEFLISGFNWGYGGEGPHGLQWFFIEMDYPFRIEEIRGWGQDNTIVIWPDFKVEITNEG